jgi:hypothetical protein
LAVAAEALEAVAGGASRLTGVEGLRVTFEGMMLGL